MKLSKLINILQEFDYELDDAEVYMELCGDYDPDVEIEIKEINGKLALVIS